MNVVEILLLALILDAILGEPSILWSRVPHPAVLMGRAVDWFDRTLNTGAQQAMGILTMVALVIGAGVIGVLVAWIPDYRILELLAVSILLAHRSLVDHVSAVRNGLLSSVEEGRQAVSLIVGRDTAALDESGVSRAAIESAAENFSDGVVAPAFWYLTFGLPGILVYKIVNTADSMIGHRSERYVLFGWAAARLDDLMNWIPARISGGLLCLVGRKRGAWELMREEAPFHRSPNAGWPEAAVAASLDVALAGPRAYGGELTQDMYINGGGRRTLVPADISRTLRLLWFAWGALVLLLAAIAGILAIA